MRAITVHDTGPASTLHWEDVPDPVPGPGEVLIEVAATAVNRADLMQRQGFYPPPPGASELLGLECSGTIAAKGPGESDWEIGDQVCALLPGGGYAEKAVADVGSLLPIPAGIDLVDAAGLPEIACTVHSNLTMTARLAAGETVLVHGGASGIGTFAIQYARELGATVLCTCSAPKRDTCTRLGASRAIDYATEDFSQVALEEFGGADVILDIIGAKYLPGNVKTLTFGGRLVVIGLQKGRRGELDLGELLSKCGTIYATSMRSRSKEGKAAVVREVQGQVWPMIESGAIELLVDQRIPLPDAQRAHDLMQASGHIGKIILVAH